MTRIDLNSQGPGIEKQDFMDRPLPTSDQSRFDILSLSLVLKLRSGRPWSWSHAATHSGFPEINRRRQSTTAVLRSTSTVRRQL